MENLYENGWFGGTTIFGNIHIATLEVKPTIKIIVPLGLLDDDSDKNTPPEIQK